MIPILFGATETSFSSNGLGRLRDCTYCLVTEERNGVFECEFAYPIAGIHYDDIQEDRIIVVSHDEQKDKQPFKIYKRSAPINGIVTFWAHHISYDLSNVIMPPFTATSAADAFNKFESISMTSNPFTFWTDNVTSGSMKSETPASIRSLLGGVKGSVLDVFGGEYEFDNFLVRNYAHRGADNGVTIRYGKNLSNVSWELDTLGLYGKVVPFWAQDGTVVYGSIVGVSGVSNTRCVALDLTSKFESAPTVQELEAAAREYLSANQPWLPKENIKIEFVPLWQTEEYKDIAPLERVQLCDTVTVYYTELGLQAAAKVIKVVWNALLDRYESIELGQARSTFAETVIDAAQQKMDDATAGLVTKSFMDDAIEDATRQITGGLGGNIVFTFDANGNPIEFLIMDTADKSTAVNVWRWNLGGLGHSHSGYEGPFNDMALTQDGKINASMITAGTLLANVIKAGILSDAAGKNYWNMETGEFSLQAVPSVIDDEINEKAQVFTSTPTVPYYVGDLWFNSTTSDIMTCVTERTSGSYSSSDWQKRNKYTDDTAVTTLNNALTQQEIFNRLTNNGQTQGIYLSNGKLYINATYIASGYLSASRIKGDTLTLGGSSNSNGILQIYDASGTLIGQWDNNGINIKKGQFIAPEVKIEATETTSYIKIPVYAGGTGYTLLNRWGILHKTVDSSSASVYVRVGATPTNSAGTSYLLSHLSVSNQEYYSSGAIRTNLSEKTLVFVNGSKQTYISTESTTAGYFSGNVYATGDLTASGTKSRLVDTKDYGSRLLYCYETPSPVFGDIGEGTISEDGKCYVWIDSIFSETVTLSQYQVFLQKYGDGDAYVSERNTSYFIVEGTPGLSFGWELKAKQSDFDQLRLEKDSGNLTISNGIDYAGALVNHIETIKEEREVNAA